jgi:hypothetical protein
MFAAAAKSSPLEHEFQRAQNPSCSKNPALLQFIAA